MYGIMAYALFFGDMLSSPYNPFESIKIDREEAHREIIFWERQLSEHALFLHLMLEDDGSNNGRKLKNEAKYLHDEFESFIKEHKKYPHSMRVMEKILPLTEELRAFKKHLQVLLQKGKWIGWIFPDFIDHVIDELDYFVNKLNDLPMAASEEIEFWNEINSEHAGFTAHLLDPKEFDLVAKAHEFSESFRSLPSDEADMFLRLSLKESRKLDEFQKAAKTIKPKSIIHPVLLDHVIRENNRSIEMLEKLSDRVKSE